MHVEREGDVTEHTNISAKGTTAGQTPARTAYIKGVLRTCVITYIVINKSQPIPSTRGDHSSVDYLALATNLSP